MVPTAGAVTTRTEDGAPVNYMQVNVTNGAPRPIQDVTVRVVSQAGSTLDEWSVREINPGQMWKETRVPGEDESVGGATSSRLFNVTVEAQFTDADGRRWLRDSEGRVRRLGRR